MPLPRSLSSPLGVSYDEKHKEANGEDNNNDGESDDEAITTH
jgi:hypothetical protein